MCVLYFGFKMFYRNEFTKGVPKKKRSGVKSFFDKFLKT